MRRLGNDDDRQLVLDFGVAQSEPVLETRHQNGKVISFAAHVRPAKSSLEPSPAVERLLLEAKRLTW